MNQPKNALGIDGSYTVLVLEECKAWEGSPYGNWKLEQIVGGDSRYLGLYTVGEEPSGPLAFFWREEHAREYLEIVKHRSLILEDEQRKK